MFKPANEETIHVESQLDVYLDIPDEIIDKAIRNCPDPSKRECPLSAYIAVNKEVSHTTCKLQPNQLIFRRRKPR